MAVNDRYDRTGQYADGDRGRKVEGFAHGYQPDGSYVGDRRDHAIGTLMGDGYRDNREGYGAILDAIENRIAAIERFGGLGEYGYYGRGLSDSYTLQDVVTARTNGGGYQFSNWSPKNREAYDISMGGLMGQPVPGTEKWYDQALDVYDSYYDPLSDLRGLAMGGTYYQNAAALSPRASAFQKAMQREFGALPVGQMGHVVTGPGLTAFGQQAYAPDWSAYDIGLPDYADDLSYAFDEQAYAEDPAYGLADPFAPEDYGTGYATPDEAFSGVGFTEDLGYGMTFDDNLGTFDAFTGTADPMAPEGYGPATAEIAPDTYGVDYGTGYAAPTDNLAGMAVTDGFAGTAWGTDDLGDYASFTGTADPMATEAYGTGYATPTETVRATEAEDFGTSAWDDDLGDYATFTGTDDPMGAEAYGAAPAGTLTGQEETADLSAGAWGDALPGGIGPAPAAPTPAAPSMTTAPRAMSASLAPQNRNLERAQVPGSWGTAAAAPPRQAQAAVPSGVVGGTGQGTETRRRSDGSIADVAGGYGGKDAFGPNDAFGGLGYDRNGYGGYADVVDSYNRTTGEITRTVTDRYGNVLDRQSVGTGSGGWDGRATGERDGGTVGDGSYSERSGYNDNNPQGIL